MSLVPWICISCIKRILPNQPRFDCSKGDCNVCIICLVFKFHCSEHPMFGVQHSGLFPGDESNANTANLPPTPPIQTVLISSARLPPPLRNVLQQNWIPLIIDGNIQYRTIMILSAVFDSVKTKEADYILPEQFSAFFDLQGYQHMQNPCESSLHYLFRLYTNIQVREVVQLIAEQLLW